MQAISPLLQTTLITSGSALFGALLGALLTGWFLLRTKNKEYVNAFFRIVIDKRVDAYEHLEHLIQAYKTCICDSDNKPYHIPFSSEEQHLDAVMRMGSTLDRGLWLSDEAFDTARELNILSFGI